MAIWKEPTPPKNDSPSSSQNDAHRGENIRLADVPVAPATATNTMSRSNGATMKESVIAAELTIEGKIEGTGHVRMAGQFKGDVNVNGNLTIEPGAKVTGSVRAQRVIIAGELEGNIDAASHVELLDTGILTGDLRAGSFVVASGSRMRGQVSFGWTDDGADVRPNGSRNAMKQMETPREAVPTS